MQEVFFPSQQAYPSPSSSAFPSILSFCQFHHTIIGKSADLVVEERNLKQAVAVVKQEREFLDDERNKFR